MKIKTRLRLNASIGLAAALLVWFPLAWSYKEMCRADLYQHQVTEMRKIALERQILRDEYLFSGKEQARLQWISKSIVLRNQLKLSEDRLTSPSEKELLAEIRRNFEDTFVIFSGIMVLREKGELSPQDEKRVALVKIRATSLTANLGRLEEILGEIAADARNRTILLLALFIAMGFIVTVGNSALINQTLSRRIGELREGAAIIGNGNLGHLLAIKGNDELTNLARMMNEMAENLQKSFTSVQNMEREIVARKETEESLRKSDEKFRLILNSTEEGIYGIDLQGDCTFANPACSRILGYRNSEEFIGKNLHQLIHHTRADGSPYPPEECRNFCVLHEGRNIHVDNEVFWKSDGSSISVEYRSYPQQVHGVVVGTVVTFVDITERREAEKSLEKSRRLLAEAQRIAHLGCWELDLVNNELTWSDETYRIFGLEPRQFCATYETFLAAVHPEDRELVNHAYTSSVEHDRPYDIVHRVVRNDNAEIRYVRELCEHTRNETGSVVHSLGIVHDVTEQHQAKEELRKLSSAIEQSPVSIVITDTHGNIEFVNPKFTQLTGYSHEESIGQNPRILKTGETPQEVYRQLWGDITSGKVWHGEFRNRKKSGEIFMEYATIAPVKSQQGEITNYIAIKEDITERRSLENQLRQAQKMEAVGTLTGGIAHDFNNILSAIIGFGSLLEMEMAKDDPLHDYVIQILAAADRAANLVRSMLAFSRKQAIEVKPVILNHIIAGMEKMLRRLIREDIELQIRITDEPLTVLADWGQIEQVLLNLTTNAKDSMPTGGTIIITIDQTELDESFRIAHSYGEPGSYALITFADNGEGMAESVRMRIFEPFFTTKEVGKGTGLGLAVCYGIIKQHHGYIVCYSEPGRGTTFRIYLPLSRLAAKQEAATATLPVTGGTETILVAEDDANVRALTTTILTEFGYTVIEARDGAEAVARFFERPDGIQLCLFDVIMPKKSGLDAYEEIKKQRSGIKVLFMSGYQAEISGHDGLLQEGVDLITKPVVPRELLKRIREVLDR